MGAARDPARERLFTASFVRLSVADLAYFAAAGIAIHALPLYVVERLGGDNASAGLAYGAFGITALICRPFAGRLVDQWGRRPLLVMGALLAGLGMVGVAYVHTVALVVLVRLVQGVAEAAFFVAGFAMLADLAPSTRRGEALSYGSLGLYLGIALGPPLSEQLVKRWGFTADWLAAAVLAAAAALVVLAVGETRPAASADQGQGRAHLIHWPAVPASIGFFSSIAAAGGFLTFAALHSAAIGMGNTSLALLIYGGTVVVGRVALARVPDRLPPLPLGSGALTLILAGLATMAVWPTPTALILGALGVGLGVTLSTPAFFTAILATAGPDQRGAASGTASAFIDLGLGFGPIALGLVARSGGIPAAFGVAAAIAGLGALWTLGVQRRRPVPPAVDAAH